MNEMNQFPKTALVIVAHPDDAEFGCGGSIAKWARDGWEVTIVVCTDASGGGADDARDVGADARRHITTTRKAEQRASAKILGAHDVIFLDLPDGLLQPTIDFRRMLVRLMRRYKPTRVVCQSPDRVWKPSYPIGRHHPDHLAVGAATMAALYPASQNAWDFPELLTEGLFPHKVRELYVVGAPEMNHFEDISDTLDIKIAALKAHASQLAANWDKIEERMRNFAAENGKLHNVAAAEIFHRTENG